MIFLTTNLRHQGKIPVLSCCGGQSVFLDNKYSCNLSSTAKISSFASNFPLPRYQLGKGVDSPGATRLKNTVHLLSPGISVYYSDNKLCYVVRTNQLHIDLGSIAYVYSWNVVYHEIKDLTLFLALLLSFISKTKQTTELNKCQRDNIFYC